MAHAIATWEASIGVRSASRELSIARN